MKSFKLVEEVLPVGYTIELLCEAHLPQTLALRNNSKIRTAFFHDQPLAMEDHVKWFASYVDDADQRVWVVCNEEEVVAQFSVYDYNPATKRAQFGRFFISPKYQGLGIGKQILALLRKSLRKNDGLVGLWLEVKPDNCPAYNLYIKTGWVETQRTSELVKMTLSRNVKPFDEIPVTATVYACDGYTCEFDY